MKRVSVIIPVYNTERYLRKCLDSLLNQTLQDIEIIVINDGSTDNSLKILEDYATAYPNLFTLINSKNQGAGKARNLGIDIAAGEYIWFVDSDDWIYPDSIEKMYNLAKQYNISMVTCDLQRRFGSIKKPSRKNGESVLIDLEQEPNRLRNVKASIGNKLIKRSLIGNTRMPGLKWEDLSFTIALAADSRKIYHLSERIYNYRMNLYNTTTRDMFNPNPRIVEIFDILNILEHNFVDRGIYESFLDQIKDIYITHVLRRAADVSMWIQLPAEKRQIIINKLVNLIELKYKNTDVVTVYNQLRSFNPISDFFLRHYGLKLLDEELRQDTDESKIKSDIVKILK